MRSIGTTRRSTQRGQTVVLIATMLGTMMLFAGLSVDLGTAYVTKARMARAADAASMVAMRNLSKGQTIATQAAKDAFAANYVAPAGQAAPTVNVTYTTDSSGNLSIGVNASSTIKTAFVGVVPAFKTLGIGASAEAIRSKLIMSLVLDRSGSMIGNGGWATLAPAVEDFIERFNDSEDKAAMATYSTAATTDVTMRQPFIAEIKNKVPNGLSDFGGMTNAMAGLQAGFDQITNTPVPAGQNISKVAVFFTDGLANTFSYSKNCSSSGYSSFSSFALGQGSLGSSTYGLYKVNGSNSTWCTDSSPPPACCNGFTTFKSIDNSTKALSGNNVYAEARLSAITVAKNMRAQDITVYSVGLGGNAVDEDFLREVANDPASAAYDSNKPTGAAFFPEDANDLSYVFQTVASKILMRLSK
jgi:Flp pilus assembly protein TadG